LGDACPGETFEGYTKHDLHKVLNKILLNRYRGEEVLKYKLFEFYSNKANTVAAFEIKVNSSRADFLAINGHTNNFEIKSLLDNFSKFQKQAQDYELVFEFNYLIVDECHVQKAQSILSDKWGLWVYENDRIKILRRPRLNQETNPRTQLSLLTKNELINFFPIQNGSISQILSNHSSSDINRQFKRILKSRYKSRWEFIIGNRKQILPLDLQFFFNNNILPKNIYY
jgi:hypothetical protein